jgi:OHCU decarboxylase
VTLDELNALDGSSAIRELRRCCGSHRWAEQVAGGRPFSSVDQLLAQADAVWRSLDCSDWLEAFAAHPRIGESRIRGAAASDWSSHEQAGAHTASAADRERLAARNREYETRFGHIFIVCVTGKSAAEMLALMEERLTHNSEEELRIAAEEQRRITRLRLAKLLAE